MKCPTKEKTGKEKSSGKTYQTVEKRFVLAKHVV